MGRSMDWTLKDNMVDGLFFCTTLTGCRWGHIPFVQIGAKTSDTSAEAIEPDPCCSWKGHTRRVGVSVRNKSTESCRVVQSYRIPSVISPEHHMYIVCCYQMNCKLLCSGCKKCLDLRRHAFALSGQMSAVWSVCPVSMKQHARDTVTPLWLNWAGWMLVRILRLSASVRSRHPNFSLFLFNLLWTCCKSWKNY